MKKIILPVVIAIGYFALGITVWSAINNRMDEIRKEIPVEQYIAAGDADDEISAYGKVSLGEQGSDGYVALSLADGWKAEAGESGNYTYTKNDTAVVLTGYNIPKGSEDVLALMSDMLGESANASVTEESPDENGWYVFTGDNSGLSTGEERYYLHIEEGDGCHVILVSAYLPRKVSLDESTVQEFLNACDFAVSEAEETESEEDSAEEATEKNADSATSETAESGNA